MAETSEVLERTYAQKAYDNLLQQVATARAVEPMFELDGIYFAANGDRLLVLPTGEGSEEGTANARKAYGWLELNGWKPNARKKNNDWSGEYMEVEFKKENMTIMLYGWMAKSCRVVTESVVIPAEPAREAKPERVEVRKRIVCENS